MVAVLPPSTDTLKLVPSSDVTVCVNESLFLMFTVAPALTGPATWKAVFCIVMTALPEPLELLLELLLHAASDKASAATTRTRTAKRARGDREYVVWGMPKNTSQAPP